MAKKKSAAKVSEEMVDEEGIDELTADLDSEAADEIQRFVEILIITYREKIQSASIENYPDFYEDYPFNVSAVVLPNDSVCLLFKSGSQILKIKAKRGGYGEVKRKLKEKWAEFFRGYPPRTGFTREFAAIEAGKMADKDIRFVKKRHNIVVAKRELASLQEEMEHMMKINPWLEDDGVKQKDRVESIKGMIETMTDQVKAEEMQRYVSYSETLDTLSRFPAIPVANPKEEETVQEPDIKESDDSSRRRGNGPDESKEAKSTDKVAQDLEIPPIIKQYGGPAQAYVAVEETTVPKPKSNRPALKPIKKKQASFELPKEIKATIFRMNRRLYKLEQSFDPVEGQVKLKMQKFNLRATHLENATKMLAENDDKMRKDIKQLFEQDKKDRGARFMAWLGVTLAILAILLSFKADILSLIP
jgi:hypothetical protein